MSGLVVGIDASRNRSGGAKAHLIGVLSAGDPVRYGIREVHVWAYQTLLEALPEQRWLIKHNPIQLEQSLPKQLWWQAFRLSQEATAAGCNVLFTTDASTLSRFKPMVVMSQDMLSYEPGVMRSFGFSMARIRLLAILWLQNQAFKHATGVIFLTRYAANVIQKSCGSLKSIAYIPHGIGEEFKHIDRSRLWPSEGEEPIQCIFISPVWKFKNQWVVVHAIEILRSYGINIKLTLIGGGDGEASNMLDKQIEISDPEGEFVKRLDFISQQKLPEYLANSDIFVFASSCENMPITLLEAMAAKLPIACSECGPMPEILKDGGVYFDPFDAQSVANAINHLIIDHDLRISLAQRAKLISKQYSWARCADETWKFIADIATSDGRTTG